MSSEHEHDAAGVPRILAVGDVVSDDFIELDKDFVQLSTDEKGVDRVSFEFGAKIPYVGAETIEAVECSPNAAVSMARLGLESALMAWVGDDGPGRNIVKYLEAQGVGTDELVVEQGKKTNYHYVLRLGTDRTKLQHFEDYSYEWSAPERRPDWLYLGVLGEKTWPLHEGILRYLQDNGDIRLAFQPGMYHLMWGAEKMKDFYARSEVVVMNREEAVTVTGGDHEDIHGLLDRLHELGPKIVAVTDGPDGAYASDGRDRLKMPLYPDPAPPMDRTGAGDAFASTFVAALAGGRDLETALLWAPINSMAVCQKLGAQAGLLTEHEFEGWLHKAPGDYRPTPME